MMRRRVERVNRGPCAFFVAWQSVSSFALVAVAVLWIAPLLALGQVFEACAFITERETSTYAFVPLQSKYDNQNTWARIDPKTRTVEYDWGAYWMAATWVEYDWGPYWMAATWSFGGIGAGLDDRTQYINGQSGTNCIDEGSTVLHSGTDPNGSLHRLSDLRATLCPPIKGKLKVPTTLLGDGSTFRDCLNNAFTKTETTITGIHHDANAKKCYAARDAVIPKIEDAIEDAGDGHFSCSFDGPVEMIGDLYKAGEAARVYAGMAGSIRECYDMVVDQLGQGAQGLYFFDNGSCEAITSTIEGVLLDESREANPRFSFVSPFKVTTREFDDCFLSLEGVDHTVGFVPRLFVPQKYNVVDGSRTWAQVFASREVDYNYGIYWGAGFSPAAYQIGTLGNWPDNAADSKPSDRGVGVDGSFPVDSFYPAGIDSECLRDGTPVDWHDGEEWIRTVVHVMQKPSQVTCPPVRGRLKVGTTQLGTSVPTWTACVDLAAETQAITAVHYDFKEKICYGAMDTTIVHISEAVYTDAGDEHFSCSMWGPVMMVGNPDPSVQILDIGSATDVAGCYEKVVSQFGRNARGARWNHNGNCGAVTDEVERVHLWGHDPAQTDGVFTYVAPVFSQVATTSSTSSTSSSSSSSTTTSKQPDGETEAESSSGQTALIIGASAGGLALLVAGVAGIVFVKRRRHDEEDEDDDGDGDFNDPELFGGVQPGMVPPNAYYGTQRMPPGAPGGYGGAQMPPGAGRGFGGPPPRGGPQQPFPQFGRPY